MRHSLRLPTIILCVSLFVLPAMMQGQAGVVSFAQLTRNPKSYHGKLIQVTGFFVHGFENSGLYPNRDWHSGHGIWVTPNGEFLAQRANLKGRYLKLTGLFSAEDHGHLRQFLGTIKVTEFEAVEEPKGR